MSELLDIVDANDQVIGQATRGDIYKNSHGHRIVHVLIFDDQGNMALQMRSNRVSFCPSHWSTAVGGHVQSGESYEDAALREFEEELGITTPVEFFSKDWYEANGLRKFLTTYKTVYSGPFSPNPEEVVEVKYFDLDEILDMIKNGEKFHPELLFLLKKYFA